MRNTESSSVCWTEISGPGDKDVSLFMRNMYCQDYSLHFENSDTTSSNSKNKYSKFPRQLTTSSVFSARDLGNIGERKALFLLLFQSTCLASHAGIPVNTTLSAGSPRCICPVSASLWLFICYIFGFPHLERPCLSAQLSHCYTSVYNAQVPSRCE